MTNWCYISCTSLFTTTLTDLHLNRVQLFSFLTTDIPTHWPFCILPWFLIRLNCFYCWYTAANVTQKSLRTRPSRNDLHLVQVHFIHVRNEERWTTHRNLLRLRETILTSTAMNILPHYGTILLRLTQNKFLPGARRLKRQTHKLYSLDTEPQVPTASYQRRYLHKLRAGLQLTRIYLSLSCIPVIF